MKSLVHRLKNLVPVGVSRRPDRPRRPRGFRPCLDVLEDRSVPAVFSVTNLDDSGAGSLRQAVLDANSQSGADVIEFAPAVHGTISLTTGQLSITDDLEVKGPGAKKLAVSGNHQSRVFSISGGVEVAIAKLTITEGRTVVGPRDGGGILNVGSSLVLDRVVMSDNQALAAATGPGRGGAVANLAGATLIVTDTLFTRNEAVGGTTSGQGSGGAIVNNASSLTVSHSTFLDNQAGGVTSAGGGIANLAGSTATITDSAFIGNQTRGGDGGSNGFARGGGLYNFQSTATVANSTFTGNRAIGGSGNTGIGAVLGQGMGGGIGNVDGGILAVTGSTFTANQALGGSNNTKTGGINNVGNGNAGALMNVGEATVTDSTFAHNEARGGSGNRGSGTGFLSVGTAAGGAIFTVAANISGDPVRLTLDRVRLVHNRAVGGDGNTAGTLMGTASGGGLATSSLRFSGPSGGSTTTISNSIIADNQAVAGRGADGSSGGDARGGGLASFFGGNLIVSDSVLVRNRAVGGAGGLGGNGGSGLGGAVFNDGPSTYPTNRGAPTILDVSGSLMVRNEAVGGAGGAGGNGGSGLGGGLYTGASPVTIRRSAIIANRAQGGAAGSGGASGEGVGGGIYIVPGGTLCVDALTFIFANDASTSDDDVFGELCFS